MDLVWILFNNSDVSKHFLDNKMKKYTVLAINGIKKFVLIGAGWGNENGNVIMFFKKNVLILHVD